ncbi:MAG: tRNA pseudouridine(55) synthase TruB [Pyrinomonadaceae bacterium]
MDGILIIDKPADWTSHDVVARCRRILKTKRIGHTGTLDPFATGVMVLLIGKATRLAQFLDKDRKEYEAVVRLGFETDTGDLTGSAKCKVQSAKFVSVDEIEKVLAKFRGEILQTPPMYSAKKVAGKKLYELARKGIKIEREPFAIKIYELQIMENGKGKTENKEKEIADGELQKTSDDFGLWTLDFGLKVSCSAGTYIRALAEDIGRELKTGAHLAALRRTRAGKFDLSQAVTLEKLEEIVAENGLDKILISLNAALGHLPEKKLSADEVVKVKNGMKIFADEIIDDRAWRLTGENENLIAVGFVDATEKIIQTKIVLV